VSLDLGALPRRAIEQGTVEGRAGYLAVQGPVRPTISS
jgi:hypothetical protein